MRLGCERPVANARSRRIAVYIVPVIADVIHDLTRLEGQSDVKFDLQRGARHERHRRLTARLTTMTTTMITCAVGSCAVSAWALARLRL